MRKRLCECRACLQGTFRLHAADRVTLCGGIPAGKFREIRESMRTHAIRDMGVVTEKCRVVVKNPDGRQSTGVRKAQEFGIPVVNVATFESLLEDVCPDPREVVTNLPNSLSDLSLHNRKVYAFDLSLLQKMEFAGWLRARGAQEGEQIRPTLVCGVCPRESLGSPTAVILRAEGVPVFAWEDINS